MSRRSKINQALDVGIVLLQAMAIILTGVTYPLWTDANFARQTMYIAASAICMALVWSLGFTSVTRYVPGLWSCWVLLLGMWTMIFTYPLFNRPVEY